MWERIFVAIVFLLICGLVGIVYYERHYEPQKVQADSCELYEHVVAITFDDGPGPYTERLLDGLAKRNVRATFFLIGESIAGREATVLRMFREGHVIGNHTFTHISLTQISREAAINEIQKTNDAIESITGEQVKYLRPPCGLWDEQMLFAMDMTPVMWSVDPNDWLSHDISEVVRRVVDVAKDGDIILFHDIYDSSVEAALRVIDILLARGYRFVTVEELMIE